MISLTGWENRTRDFADAHNLPLSRGQIKHTALKIHKRAASMQHVDPDDLIRMILDYKDDVGEEAIHHAEGHGYCKFCGLHVEAIAAIA